MKGLLSLLTALQLLSLLPARCLCRSGDTWTLMQVQCVSETRALHRLQASSDVHCTVAASNKESTGIIVVQFRPASLQCSLFRYQSVCRELLSGASADCRVLIRSPISYSAAVLSPKLRSVWIGDEMSRFDNAVCQADEATNRIQPLGVQWTEEGASIDGSSSNSYLAMTQSDISFSTGMTVLLRLKRLPQPQPFIEFLNCSNFETGPVSNHIWEFSAPCQPYVLATNAVSGVPTKNYKVTGSPMSSNASKWINLGFTINSAGDSWAMFLGDKFLPQASITVSSITGYKFVSPSCFRFGKRYGDVRRFNGVVKAIAMGSVEMPETEMKQFFDLL